MSRIMEFTQEDIATILTEWDRRYRENPEEFWNVVQHLLRETPETYGQESAPYFIYLAEELGIIPPEKVGDATC